MTAAREALRRAKWVIAVAVLCALAPVAAAVAASGPTHLQGGVGPAPLLVPIPLWLPLGAAIFAAQIMYLQWDGLVVTLPHPPDGNCFKKNEIVADDPNGPEPFVSPPEGVLPTDGC